MTRDEARHVITVLVATGAPVSVRQRDRLIELAEVDNDFRRVVNSYAGMSETRDKQNREDMRRLNEMFRPLLDGLDASSSA